MIAAGCAFIAPPYLLPITIHPTNNDEDNEQERIYPGPPPRFRSHCKLRLHCSAPLSANAFAFDSTDHAAGVFDLQIPAYLYTRLNNPTTDVLEQRLAALKVVSVPSLRQVA